MGTYAIWPIFRKVLVMGVNIAEILYTPSVCIILLYSRLSYTPIVCVCGRSLFLRDYFPLESREYPLADGFSFLITIMADTDRAVSNLGKRRRMAQKRNVQRNKDLQHTLVAYLVECKMLNCYDNIQEDERKGIIERLNSLVLKTQVS